MTLEELKELKHPKCFYTKEETDAILKSISLKVVVEQLPEYGKEGYLYLVPSIADPNVYELFIWNNDTWESLGTVNKEEYLDYVTNPELDNAINEVKNLHEVTYAELRLLVQNSKLIPGALYRITDYITTTTQTDTQSAGHQFDIIVTALSTNTLSENASAIQHEGDTYFAKSNLSAWQVWYCLENNKVMYGWADDNLDNSYPAYITEGGNDTPLYINRDGEPIIINGNSYNTWGETTRTSSYIEYLGTVEGIPRIGDTVYKLRKYLKVSNTDTVTSYSTVDKYEPKHIGKNIDGSIIVELSAVITEGEAPVIQQINLKRLRGNDETISGVSYYAWVISDGGGEQTLYTTTLEPNANSSLYMSTGDSITDINTTLPPGASYSITYQKGVVAYRGKGVIYRLIDEFNNDVPYDFKNIQFKRKLTNGEYDPTNGTDTWVYTFTTFLLSGILYDNSLGIDLSLSGGSGIITLCAENIIKPCYNYEDQMSILGGQGEIILNNNVFLSPNGDMILSFIYANEFDVNSNMNTFLGLAQENTFGSRCISNKFGLDCSGNNIGKRFTNNVIDNECLNNIIGNNVYNCQFNYCTKDNIFGNDISNCIFGNPGSVVNSSDSSFHWNTIGNGCYHLNLIGDIIHFTIGNGVHHFNITEINADRVIVENGVSYVTLDCPSSDLYEKICQNITIAQGVRGTSSAQKTISHPTVNDTFQTIYRPVNSLIISV